MKKKEYIIPSLFMTTLMPTSLLAASGSVITGSSTNNFGDAEVGSDGEEADVKSGPFDFEW